MQRSQHQLLTEGTIVSTCILNVPVWCAPHSGERNSCLLKYLSFSYEVGSALSTTL